MSSEIRKKLANPFKWLVVVLGALAALSSVSRLSVTDLDWKFLVLAVITLALGSRVIVQIPRCRAQVSVSDTFIMLVLLLFSPEAAVLLSGADGLTSSLRVSKIKINIAFNTAAFMCSTFATGLVLSWFFGSLSDHAIQNFSPNFLLALSVMGFTQYAANSVLVATAVALRAGEGIIRTWQTKFLWTSLTYFAGAFAAGIIAKLTEIIGFSALLATAPIIAIVYFTYSIYLKNIEAATRQAELAQNHINELSHHIAVQEQISSALRESEEHFRTAFDHAVGMALISPGGSWLEVNESLATLLGYPQPAFEAMSLSSVIHPKDLEHTQTGIRRLLAGEIKSFQLENRCLHKQGHIIWTLFSASLVRTEDGRPKHLVLQIQNISDRKQAEEQIQHAAFHDALTGLPNRSLLSERMSLAVKRAKRQARYEFAVLFIDLDRFKVVNDTMGHKMGDKLLINLSDRLQKCVRAADTVARLGGDEFAVLLDGISHPEIPVEIASRIQQALKEPFDLDGQDFFTSASIGISYSSIGYERPEDILRDADTAMYRAKANGKARHEVFDLGMHTRAVDALKLENDLRQAIEKDEIQPHFQIIVSLPTGAITGFEALARWEHPQRGVISPIDFIPLAEETGLIIPLGLSILTKACRQLRQWQNLCSKEIPLTMSVNLSARQFAQKTLFEDIKTVLKDTGVEPHSLRLEITESVVMENAVAAAEILSQLNRIGVQLAIDDFGTGYSSLSYLHRFPFDILKIDRSFVAGMSTDQDSRSIVETIITLANKLGKSTIAEGVETEDHKNLLAEFSCGFAQGYLFSKPLNAADAEKLLETRGVFESDCFQFSEKLPQGVIDSLGHRYPM